jgi:hypothetical protein
MVTTKEVIKIQNELHSGLGDMSARIVEKQKIQPCGGCKDRKQFLDRIFVGGVQAPRGKKGR